MKARAVLFSYRLNLQLCLLRLGKMPIFALALLVLSAGVDRFVLPELQARSSAAQLALAELRQAHPPSPEQRLQGERYAAFRERLADAGERDDLLKLMFAVAEQAGMTLPQGDYQRAFDSDGAYQKLQVTLPLKGSYSQIRAFIDAMLVKLPAASLDEISFRRDSIKNTQIEAKLKVTLYLKERD